VGFAQRERYAQRERRGGRACEAPAAQHPSRSTRRKAPAYLPTATGKSSNSAHSVQDPTYTRTLG
jgi:hypothetical protein